MSFAISAGAARLGVLGGRGLPRSYLNVCAELVSVVCMSVTFARQLQAKLFLVKRKHAGTCGPSKMKLGKPSMKAYQGGNIVEQGLRDA
jgi:hypothetical protein